MAVVAALFSVVPWRMHPAGADTAPPVGTPATASADALPTWQINGVVWSQVVVGNTVYATGSFTKARPPGVAAGGTGEIAANNIFAYSLTNGNPISNFSHSLNGQGLAITASPDGSRVYVGGDFTTVDGAARNHVAAFTTATGALVTSFVPSLSGQVAALTASSSTLYVGGNFFSANGATRRRLASYNTATGALLSWAPTADDYKVAAMALSPDGSRVIVGGSFTTLNGNSANSMGAVDATSGASLPWAANTTIRDGGNGSGITSLTTDGQQIYGSGYAFQSGSFEGAFAADPSTGNIAWLNDCHGDTYDVAPIGQVLYTVSHAHDCSWIGAFFQSNPWSINMRHALAFTTYPTGTNTGPDNYGWNYNGIPDSTLLQWYPQLAIGSYTGQNQAAWSVKGNSNYISLGGEFPSINGTAQQGLARFAVRSLATNKRGPVRAPGAPAPQAVSLAPNTARVSWQSCYDMDNATLTYNVYRSGTVAPVYTTTKDSNFWTYPMVGYIDRGLTAGKPYTYTVKVTDPIGNIISLPTTNSVTVGSGSMSQYEQDVTADGASAFWRLGEPSGPTVYDHAGFNDAAAQAGVTRGSTGAISGDPDQASTFSGTNTGFAVSNSTMTPTPSFSIEAWIKTTTTSGGKIVGYGSANSGDSGSYDRHIYMDNAGHVIFGVYTGGVHIVPSPATYNDGAWHQIVASQDSANGMALYVDGKRVARDQSTTTAQPYTGYWRIGGDNLNGWPNQPSSNYFGGTIDDVALYPSAISLSTIQRHYTDSGRTLNIPVPPADNYGKAVYQSGPDFYWRLGEATGTTAADSSVNGTNGLYSGGVTYGAPGAISGTSNTAVTLNGSDGAVASAAQTSDPTVYSEEMWFKTTTGSGGKLIGFGSNQTGPSSSYDRHVYMTDSGQLIFGVWTGFTNTITSAQSYNDGSWHYVVATQGSDGMTLYVDGQSVGTNPQAQSQAYDGYWRLGGDTTWGGNSSNYFAGTIDEAAVYSTELSASTVQSHYAAAGGAVPNQPPTAAFTSTASGLNATFDGSGSSDPDGTIASYSWNYGDNSPAGSGATASHTYAAPGTYPVALTVTDNQGATNTVTKSVSVTNTAPTAAFTSSTAALVASFDGSGSADTDGTIASYGWNFGDGTAAGSGKTTNHVYAAPGTYAATLTVTDNAGATGTITHNVTVAAANQAPTAAFDASMVNLTGSFDGSSSSDPDGTIASYAWTFGDGATATTAKPTHTYGGAGSYTVTLTVTDNSGATAQVTHTVVASSADAVPRPDHVVVVVEENHSEANVIGNAAAPYINSLATGGANMTQSFAVTHPSQPNYLALFSGNNQGVTDDSCPHTFTTTSLYDQLIAAGASFTGYSEDMPSAGYTGCSTATYVRKHNPWVDFTSVPSSANQPFSSFPSDYTTLPKVSFVIPNLQNDMHDGTIAQGDTWLQSNIDGYVQWAKTHNSLLVLTWDENDNVAGNQIPTVIVGPRVKPGNYSTSINHYNVLRTIEDAAGTGTVGASTSAAPITNIWQAANQPPTAAFTSSVNGMSASFDGSGSSDPDGTIASYTWDFGDGATATGVTPSHTYATAGSYNVRLTVTDNGGATAAVTHSITVTGAQPVNLAADTFSRTVSNGWGTADTGGAWSVVGTKSLFAVDGNTGSINLTAAGSGPQAYLNAVSSTRTDTQVTASASAASTGAGTFMTVIGRQIAGSGSYRAGVNLRSDGRVSLALVRVDPAGQANIAPATIIPGLTYAPGDKLHIRLLVTGASPTQLSARVWKDGTAEPTTWQVAGADTASAMQVAGGIGLMAYVSGTTTTLPVLVRFDDLTAADPGAGAAPQAKAKVFGVTTLHESTTPTAATRVSPPFGKAAGK
ncbi:MAG: PKD domain-containing protein [Mycobacteriales bacterium]